MDGIKGKLYRGAITIISFALVWPMEGCKTIHATVADCKVGITVVRVPQSNTDALCRAGRGDLTSDSGEPITAKDTILGCADTQNRVIVAPDNDRVMAHELRHILDEYCGKGETRD